MGITERAAHKMIKDLGNAGYVTKTKVGRKNHYRIHPDVPLKDEVTDAAVGELLVMLGWRWRRTRVSESSLEKPQVMGAGIH